MTDTAVATVLAVVAGLALRAGARGAVARLRPGIAVRILTAGSLLATLALGLTLSAVGLAVAGRTALVAAMGDWSAPVLTVLVPIPAWLGTPAAVAAVLLGASALLRCARIAAALTRAEMVSRRLRGGRGPVVLLRDHSVDAYTIAGIRGCVVVGEELLGRLGPLDRRALMAHELSHLTHRHHLYLHVVDLAASANPLLRSVPSAVRLGVERWADEDAVVALGGDRRAVARALARTARIRGGGPAAPDRETAAATARDRETAGATAAVTATGGAVRRLTGLPARSASGLAMAASHLGQRAAALLGPRPPSRRPPVLTLVAVATTAAAVVTATVCAGQIHDRMEIAQRDVGPVPYSAAPYSYGSGARGVIGFDGSIRLDRGTGGSTIGG